MRTLGSGVSLHDDLTGLYYAVDTDDNGGTLAIRVAVKFGLDRPAHDIVANVARRDHFGGPEELPAETGFRVAEQDADTGVGFEVAASLAVSALPVGEVFRIPNHNAALVGDVRLTRRRGAGNEGGDAVFEG